MAGTAEGGGDEAFWLRVLAGCGSGDSGGGQGECTANDGSTFHVECIGWRGGVDADLGSGARTGLGDGGALDVGAGRPEGKGIYDAAGGCDGGGGRWRVWRRGITGWARGGNGRGRRENEGGRGKSGDGLGVTGLEGVGNAEEHDAGKFFLSLGLDAEPAGFAGDEDVERGVRCCGWNRA